MAIPLPATDPNGDPLTLRIVSQPAHGSVGLAGTTATYFPEPGFVGNDHFTFAAWDGSTDSNLATGAVAVAQGPFSLTSQAHVPPSFPAGWPAPFRVVATPSNVLSGVAFAWTFGDGSPTLTNQYPVHTYPEPGTYTWHVVSTTQPGASQATATSSGQITILAPETLQITPVWNGISVSWPRFEGDAILEWTAQVGPAAHWRVDTNLVSVRTDRTSVSESKAGPVRFYRLRQL